MPKFGSASLERLATLDPRLRLVLEQAIEIYDFTILCGARNRAEQDAAVAAGNSKTPWPRSKHNSQPSRAVDIAPYPIDWKDRERFAFLAGIVRAIGYSLGVPIRWGGDFNQNDRFDDDFVDMPHFELV